MPNSPISAILDERSFHEVFLDYYTTLCLFANHYVEDEAMAADIVQDVFVNLWQHRDTFDQLHQIKPYLYTAVRNRALNAIEHQQVMLDYSEAFQRKHREAFFHDAVVEQEMYHIVLDAVNRLPVQMRTIMLLSLEEKKNAEIAKEMGISVETVHTLKKLAYKKLREFLKDYYYLLFLFI